MIFEPIHIFCALGFGFTFVCNLAIVNKNKG